MLRVCIVRVCTGSFGLGLIGSGLGGLGWLVWLLWLLGLAFRLSCLIRAGSVAVTAMRIARD